MARYNFDTLSPIDFEELCQDLIAADLGIKLQHFGPGADGGIDLLCSDEHKHLIVVQCKHYARAGYSALKRAIKSDATKIAKLKQKPYRYILATSVPMTMVRKNQILKIVGSLCEGHEDIYGQEDLNRELRSFPDIERSHHKLWLTSEAIIRRMLHQASEMFRDHTEDSIRRRLSLYVRSDAFNTAIQLLRKHHYCIISGIPGIGKSTLAEMLVADYMKRGFRLVVAHENIKEAMSQIGSATKCVLYYDDFLGRSSLAERLGKNEDASILKVLAMARGSKSLRVILTTREYILKEAQRSYARLNDSELEIAKCIVALDNYSRSGRARILYNHLHFYGVSKRRIASILHERRYATITDHKNYSPRIIEWMTNVLNSEKISPDKYASEFVDCLDNPLRIWESAYTNDINDDARGVLRTMATFPNAVDGEILLESWLAFGYADQIGDPAIARRRFYLALRLLDGTFLRIDANNRDRIIGFHNPSIRDYLLRTLAEDVVGTKYLAERVLFFQQLVTLAGLDNNGKVSVSANGSVIALNSGFLDTIRRCLQEWRVPGAVVYGDDIFPVAARKEREFAKALEWAKEYDREDIVRVVVNAMADHVAEDERGAVDGAATIRSIATLCEAFPQEADEARLLLRTLLERAVPYLDSDEWEELGDLVDRWGTQYQFGTRDDYLLDLEEHIHSRVDGIIDDARSEEDLRAGMRELKDFELEWNIAIGDHIDKIRNAKEEVNERAAKNSYNEPREVIKFIKTRDDSLSDQQLDRLFRNM
jgi:hypothetical protein